MYYEKFNNSTTQCTVGIIKSDLQSLLNILTDSYKYFLWQSNGSPQTFESRMMDINKMTYHQIYITSIRTMRTVAELEIWEHTANLNSELWVKHVPELDKINKTFIWCPLNGSNIPESQAFELKKQKFYDKYINVFKNSNLYLDLNK